MKLSENFSLEEFQRSMTAMRLGIDNTVPEELLPNGIYLVENILQPLRTAYGKVIRVASGFRCHPLNSYIKGASNSQHTKFEAADIDTVSDNLILFKLIIELKLPFDQLIWEFGDEIPEWIHISAVREKKPRGQMLRAYRDSNQRVNYRPFSIEELAA